MVSVMMMQVSQLPPMSVRPRLPTQGSAFFRTRTGDLAEEELEELRMISGFPPSEIVRLRQEFVKLTSGEHESMTTEEFLTIPTVRASMFAD